MTWLGAYAALTAYGRHSTVVSSLVATLEARIIAVCDAWAAMRVNRPYSRALTDDQAREQLVKGRGSQFDPTVVDAFLSLLDEGAIEARDPAGRRAQIPSSISRSRSQT